MKRGRERTDHTRTQFGELRITGPVADGTTYHARPFKATAELRTAIRIERDPLFRDSEHVPSDFVEVGPGTAGLTFQIDAFVNDPQIIEAIVNGDVELIGEVKIKGKTDAVSTA